MNEPRLFSNPEFGDVRTITIEGVPYFVGKDVAEILRYNNTQKAIRDHVDDEDKLAERIVLSGQNRDAVCINESGLYSLILSSKMPRAKQFKHWVTSEVLPSIRKTGVYMTDNAIEQVLSDPDSVIKLATKWKEERTKRLALQSENAQQKQMLAEYSPKASYYDVVLQTPDTLSASKIAKDYGKSARWLNSYLHEKGVQYKQGGVWLLYQKYAEQGYTKSKTVVVPGSDGAQHSTLHTYWKQAGRLFIYNLLKSDGILPVMEREETNENRLQ